MTVFLYIFYESEPYTSTRAPEKVHLRSIVWNVRGFDNSVYVNVVKQLIRKHMPKVMILIDTELSGHRITEQAEKLPFNKFLGGFFSLSFLRF